MYLIFSNIMINYLNIVCDVAFLKYYSWHFCMHLNGLWATFYSSENSTHPFSQSRHFILSSILTPPAHPQPQQLFQQLHHATCVSFVYIWKYCSCAPALVRPVSKTVLCPWAAAMPFSATAPCEMMFGGIVSRVNGWPKSSGSSSTFVLPVSSRYLNASSSFHMLWFPHS